MKILSYFLFLCILLITSSCSYKNASDNQKLVSLQMIDRHGFNETISAPDRVRLYEQTDFLASQSYSKVIRVFSRTKSSPSKSIITSYHDNGQTHQYLEVENGRAHGVYKQWYPSGALQIKAFVIEGLGDVSNSSMSTWVFDKESVVFDENGVVLAKISYEKGDLQGNSAYFYENGQMRKLTPYEKNEIHGEELYYNKQGDIVGKFQYVKGLRDKESKYFGDEESPQFHEYYEKGKLIHAKYYDENNLLVSVVQKGNGLQTCYQKGVLHRQFEMKDGERKGKVYCYNLDGRLEREYSEINGDKHGEEWLFDTTSEEKKPKVYLSWYEGKIQGRVKTWYPNGQLECEKQMHDNKKNGLLTAWYLDGTVMMIEDYENDQLLKGTYMKKGEKSPVSTITRGQGTATIYDAHGYLLRKVEYVKGAPVE